MRFCCRTALWGFFTCQKVVGNESKSCLASC
nr:MAG TPA: hypothetical protein [Caudoviricetes sp.]